LTWVSSLGSVVPMQAGPNQSWHTELSLDRPMNFRLQYHYQDDKGGMIPTSFQFNASVDFPPQLKWKTSSPYYVRPSTQRFTLEVLGRDDYGISEIQLLFKQNAQSGWRVLGELQPANIPKDTVKKWSFLKKDFNAEPGMAFLYQVRMKDASLGEDNSGVTPVLKLIFLSEMEVGFQNFNEIMELGSYFRGVLAASYLGDGDQVNSFSWESVKSEVNRLEELIEGSIRLNLLKVKLFGLKKGVTRLQKVMASAGEDLATHGGRIQKELFNLWHDLDGWAGSFLNLLIHQGLNNFKKELVEWAGLLSGEGESFSKDPEFFWTVYKRSFTRERDWLAKKNISYSRFLFRETISKFDKVKGDAAFRKITRLIKDKKYSEASEGVGVHLNDVEYFFFPFWSKICFSSRGSPCTRSATFIFFSLNVP